MDFLFISFFLFYFSYFRTDVCKEKQLHILQLPLSHKYTVVNYKIAMYSYENTGSVIPQTLNSTPRQFSWLRSSPLFHSRSPIGFWKATPIHSDGIAPDSHRILFCASIWCNLRVITLHIFNSDTLFLSHLIENVNTICLYFLLMFFALYKKSCWFSYFIRYCSLHSQQHVNNNLYSASVSVLKKQVLLPVWQAAPICSTFARMVSLSQSRVRDFTNWRWPEVRPLVQSSLRLLLQ